MYLEPSRALGGVGGGMAGPCAGLLGGRPARNSRLHSSNYCNVAFIIILMVFFIIKDVFFMVVFFIMVTCNPPCYLES